MTQEDKMSVRLEEHVQASRQISRQIRLSIKSRCDGELNEAKHPISH